MHEGDHLHTTEDPALGPTLVVVPLPAGDDGVLVAGGVVVGTGEELAGLGRLLNVPLCDYPSPRGYPSHHLEYH